MDRRTFVTSMLASAGTLSLSPRAAAQALLESSHLPARFADLHCHIFNADDLPIEGFVRKVVIPSSKELQTQFKGYPGAFIALIKIVSQMMKEAAPTAVEEIQFLNRIEQNPDSAPTAADRRAKDLRFIRKLLDRIWSRQVPRGLEFKDAYAVTIAVTKLQQILIEEVYPSFFCCGANTNDMQGVPLGDLAARLYASNGPIGRNVRWALLFTRNRFELADALESFHESRAVLLTPALVDFSKWLEDNDVSSLSDQVAVMAKIAARQTGPRVHPFMAFDPLRQALHTKNGGDAAQSPLAIARKAIAEDGFIGIKLYPPMGFKPFNNAAEGAKFPAHVRKPGALGDQAGKLLDGAMAELFTWCAAERVPIMAHAANSNGSATGYGLRADPANWVQLMKQPQFAKLRVNLAHFGGFEQGGSFDKSWEWTIAKAWKAAPDSYLYADISYFSELLQSTPARRKTLVAAWKALREQFPQSASRLIYGSDWAMLGREKGIAPIDLNAHKAYSALVADFLSGVGYSDDQIVAIMWRNAGRFLGLGIDERASGTRGRLERFYQAKGITTDWLNAFGT